MTTTGSVPDVVGWPAGAAEARLAAAGLHSVWRRTVWRGGVPGPGGGSGPAVERVLAVRTLGGRDVELVVAPFAQAGPYPGPDTPRGGGG